ncbi:MAG: hypothetical protein EXR62_14970 [Chloroflexi bacterium]|nr:hypothetical protein [Chloroflexota bacterium]
MWHLFLGALALDQETYDELTQSEQAFRRGFALLMVVGLMIGLVNAGTELTRHLLAPPLVSDWEILRQNILGVLNFRRWDLLLPLGLWQQLLDYINATFNIAQAVNQAPRPLSAPFPEIFVALGVFVSYPFNLLGFLFLYSLLVHFFTALILRGSGSVRGLLGGVSLAAAPQIFTVFAPLPGLGLLFGFIASVWSLAAFMQGVAAAYRFSAGKAFLATFLPMLVVITLILLVGGIAILVSSLLTR